MKKVISLIMSICMVVGMIPFSAYAANITPEISLDEFSEQLSEMSEEYTDEPVSNRLIVKSERKIDKLDSVDVVEGYDDLHIVQFDNSESADEALEHYNDSRYIDFAEPDLVMSTMEYEDATSSPVTVTGNTSGIVYDNHLSWGSESIGVDDYIDYLGEVSTLPEIVVGIIDTGIDLDHEFLKDRIIPTGINYSSSGAKDSEEDDNGHGTHVAGIIADNTTENVKIKAFKCLDSTGSGSLSNVVLAINSAVSEGVNIINLSLGAYGNNVLLENTINQIVSNNITVCVAAGNNGTNASKYTPANIDSAITVSSIDAYDVRPWWANFGEQVDIVAPGVSIYSTYNDGNYKTLNGTSMACPFVAAASALILSKNPQMNCEDIYATLNTNGRKHWTNIGSLIEKPALYIGTITTYSQERTAMPTFNIKGGKYSNGITIELSCIEDNNEIYYTLDGTRASQDNGILYTEPIYIDKVTSIHAVAYAPDKLKSLQAIEEYYITSTDSDLNFTIDSNGLITKYDGNNNYLTIPETIKDITVTGIGENVFYNSDIVMIKMPDTLTYIGKQAFMGCKSLYSVNASNITYVEEYGFRECMSLEEIEMQNITYAGKYAFSKCEKLSSINCPKLTEVNVYTFAFATNVVAANLPNVVTIYDSGMFSMHHLETINLNSLENLGSRAFMTDVNLSSINLPNVNSLDSYGFQFYMCHNLQSIYIPKFKGTIPNSAFASCKVLEEIYIPNVTKIESSVFNSSPKIKNIFVPNLISAGSLPQSNTAIYLSDSCSELPTTEYKYNIIAPTNSYAERWANDNGHTFMPSDYRDESIAAPTNVTDLGRSICCSAAGVRFGFTWDNIDEIESLAADIEYGFIYSQKGAENLSIDTVDNKNIKKTVANNRVDHGETTSFNLVISNIPKSYYDRKITARAYVCIDGMYFYSNILKGSFSEVAQLVLADNEIDTNTKNAINNLLSKEV